MILSTFASNDELLTALFEDLPEEQRSQMALLLGDSEVLFFDWEDAGWRKVYQAVTPNRVVHVECTTSSGNIPDRWEVGARRLRDVAQVRPAGAGHLSLAFTEIRAGGSGHLVAMQLGYTKPVPAAVVDFIFAA